VTQRRQVEELDLFLAERGRELLRAAVLLAGSREAGEDLLQDSLERLLRKWRAIDGNPEGYLRRTMYNLAADGWRRQARWRARLPLLRSRSERAEDDTARVDLHDALIRMLATLPSRQRAVLVLRYWEQLSEAEAAELIGCSPAAAKAAAARGLRRLRELADAGEALDPERPCLTGAMTEERS
jgi:RNA polymerase sigma-70 factor (sigma-E family)